MSEGKAKKSRQELIKLSRIVSHALRHAPEEYDLKLDHSGWVDIPLLLQALHTRSNQWKGLTQEDLLLMAVSGDKLRYEFNGTLIRAIYGHSVSNSIEYEEALPPERLYHGTTRESASRIMGEGLKSMKRQYVHLSLDLETAIQVALRRTSKPVLLEIAAQEAHRLGVKFFKGNDHVWLAKHIDKEFIKERKE